MTYYKALFNNRQTVCFDAKNSESALNKGNKKAKQQRSTMVAIEVISYGEAFKLGIASN